jgi:type I restriction enzyme S subunit
MDMLLSKLNLLAIAPGGVARLRELILTLAVQGKLMPQDPKDEPASELLKKTRAEKDRLIAAGKIKRDKPLAAIAEGVKPFGLPQGWEWSNLATVGVINPRNDASDEAIASFVEMRSIPAAFSAAHTTESRPWRDIKSGFTQFAEGDVGVAKITPCFENGKSTVFENLSNGIGAGTTELHIVRPLGGIAPRYVLLFLKTPAFLMNGESVMTGSAGQKRMPRTYFESTPFPLPPLAEQSRIVTRVEELMRLCDALEAKGQLEATQHAQLVSTLLGTLTESETPEERADNWQRVATHFDLLLDRPEAVDALEQTILQMAVRGLLVPQDPQDEPASELLTRIRAEKDRLIAEGKIKRDKPLAEITEEEKPFELPVGWEWAKLAELLPAFQNGASSRGDTGGCLVTVLRLADIKNKRVSLADTRQIPIAEADIEKYRLLVGDILITRVNGSADIVGQFNLCDTPLEAIYCDHFIRMRIDQRWITPEYCSLLGESSLVRGSIKSLFITTAGQKTVNQGHMGSLTLPLAPLAEQPRIVARVAALRALCADLRQRLTTARTQQALLVGSMVKEVT